MKKIVTLLLLAACSMPVLAQSPRVWLDTDRGPIIVELDPAAAPVTVENFLRYVNDGFYDGLIFHRVSSDFVIQAGGFDENLEYRDATYDEIVNEADNGLSNLRGTIAMARTSEPDSATSQFFINVEDNVDLDPGAATEAGYAVFGEVVYGLSTVDAISEIATSNITSPIGTLQQYPRNPPVIRRAAQTDSFPLMPLHSGSWFDPARPGFGFNVEVSNDASDGSGPVAVVYWYDFDTGRQFWLTGQASFDYGADAVTVPLYSHPGTGEGVDFQQPPDSFEQYGSVTLRFDDCRTGQFEYDLPGYGNGEIEVTRLTIPDGHACPSP